MKNRQVRQSGPQRHRQRRLPGLRVSLKPQAQLGLGLLRRQQGHGCFTVDPQKHTAHWLCTGASQNMRHPQVDPFVPTRQAIGFAVRDCAGLQAQL